MLKIAALTGLVLLVVVSALRAWRRFDARSDEAAWDRVAASRRPGPAAFDPRSVDALPEPARRFFRFAILPGTPLSRAAEIDMGGEIGLGSRDAPAYMPMAARQILALPEGFVWCVRAGSGLMRVSGSDGMTAERSWVRFWLLGLLPLARAGGDADHLRSAFGRVAAEAVFWSPAALLPDNGVTWEAIDADSARATVRRGALTQAVDIAVDPAGRLRSVVLPRWTNANPDKIYRVQPFGGTADDFREVDGFRLPFSVDGGNQFGTDDYFPFFRARVRSIRMLRP